MQCFWSAFLVLPRTHDRVTGAYGNLYSNLLDYVISAALLFYILTVAGLFRLRRTRPDANRPYRAWGYPWLPALYIAGASVILVVLFIYRTTTTWPGLLIVASGVPIYLAIRPRKPPDYQCPAALSLSSQRVMLASSTSSGTGPRSSTCW
jgi:APA family basic amino acid/polyamine antiporter